MILFNKDEKCMCKCRNNFIGIDGETYYYFDEENQSCLCPSGHWEGYGIAIRRVGLDASKLVTLEKTIRDTKEDGVIGCFKIDVDPSKYYGWIIIMGINYYMDSLPLALNLMQIEWKKFYSLKQLNDEILKEVQIINRTVEGDNQLHIVFHTNQKISSEKVGNSVIRNLEDDYGYHIEYSFPDHDGDEMNGIRYTISNIQKDALSNNMSKLSQLVLYNFLCTFRNATDRFSDSSIIKIKVFVGSTIWLELDVFENSGKFNKLLDELLTGLEKNHVAYLF